MFTSWTMFKKRIVQKKRNKKCRTWDELLCSHVPETWITYLSAFFHTSSCFFSFIFHPRYSKNSFFWCWWCVRICISYFIRNISYIALHFTASFVCGVCVLSATYQNHCVLFPFYMHDTHNATSFIRPVLLCWFRCAVHSMLCIWTVRTYIVRSPLLSLFTSCSPSSVPQSKRVLQIRIA